MTVALAAARMVTHFDGLGVGFTGPQPMGPGRNPSDNSLAVGPNHIVQIVNSKMAVFDKTGKVLYGAVPTNTLFKGFGGFILPVFDRVTTMNLRDIETGEIKKLSRTF